MNSNDITIVKTELTDNNAAVVSTQTYITTPS